MEAILEKINGAALRLLSQMTEVETQKTIVHEAMKLVNAEYGSIVLERNGVLKRAYSSDSMLKDVKIRKDGFTSKAYDSKKTLAIGIEKTSKVHPMLKKLHIRSTIFIPIVYRNKSIGVLIMHSPQEEYFSKRELGVLSLFGSMASLALVKAQTFDEIEKALDVRDYFISIASHELRTPLTSINGYIQLLHSRFAGKDTIEAKWVHELYEESERLTKLVRELLEVNRIKQGQLHFVLTESHLSDVLEKAVERSQVANRDKQFTYSTDAKDGMDIVIGDKDKLLQVFSGLLDNAAKFSPVNSIISSSLNVGKTRLKVVIRDQGIGIDKGEIDKIFDGFYKGKNFQLSGGLGVGLILAKHIVGYHKGTMKIKSALTKGTTIEICLPRARV